MISNALTHIIQTLAGKRIVFAGVGNVLKQDDGLGVFITQNIRRTDRIIPLVTEVSIENYIGRIHSLQPDVLIIVDAVDFRQEPGYVALMPATALMDTTTHTHNISLRQLTGLFSMPVLILGVQPRNVSFGEGLSVEVQQACIEIFHLINAFEMSYIEEEKQPTITI